MILFVNEALFYMITPGTSFFICVILPCFRANSHQLGCCHVQVSSYGKAKESMKVGSVPVYLLIFRHGSGTDVFCSYSLGKNLVFFPHLTARKSRNYYSIAGRKERTDFGGQSLPLLKTRTVCYYIL